MRAACVAIVALASACHAPPYRAYEGPKLPGEQLAIVRAYDDRWNFLTQDSHIRFETIHGKPVASEVASAYVMPGPVELEVSLYELTAAGAPQFPRRLEFDAEAGHAYAIAHRRSRHSPPWAFRVTDGEHGKTLLDTEVSVDACRARVAPFERAGWAAVDWYQVGRWHSVSWSPVDAASGAPLEPPAERVELLFGAIRSPDAHAASAALDYTDAATLHDAALDFAIEFDRAHKPAEWRVLEQSSDAVSSAWSGTRKEGGEPWAGLALLRPARDGLQVALYERRGPPLTPEELATWRSALDEARLP